MTMQENPAYLKAQGKRKIVQVSRVCIEFLVNNKIFWSCHSFTIASQSCFIRAFDNNIYRSLVT